MDGFGSLGLDCRMANNYYDVFPLGWIGFAWQTCEYYFHDFSWASIIFLCLGSASLAACGILVLVVKKLWAAGFLIGCVLTVLCAIACVPNLLLMGSGFGGGSPSVLCFLLLNLAVPVLLIVAARSGRPGLMWLSRVLLILAMACILIVYPSLDVAYAYNNCGQELADCPWIESDLHHFFTLEYVFSNIGNLVLFPALLVLASTPRGTQKAAQTIPREDASSAWYGVLGFVIPIVGLIGWLMWRKATPLRARSIGIGAWVGTIAYVIVGVVYYLVNHSNTMNALY